MWFSVALMKFHWSGINWHVLNQSECRNCCLYIIIQKIAPQAKSGNTSKYGFSPDLGGKNGGLLSMRMQVILDSSFACPGSAPIWGGKKGEFRDWTRQTLEKLDDVNLFTIKKKNCQVIHSCPLTLIDNKYCQWVYEFQLSFFSQSSSNFFFARDWHE